MNKFSTKSKERLTGVNSKLIKVITLALERSPIDFGIPKDGGVRTVERQQELYAQGRTKPGDIITKTDGITKKSEHQSGNAVDVFAYINGAASWDKIHLAIIAGVVYSVAKELGIKVVWGGTFGSRNFTGWDSAHFQIEN